MGRDESTQRHPPRPARRPLPIGPLRPDPPAPRPERVGAIGRPVHPPFYLTPPPHSEFDFVHRGQSARSRRRTARVLYTQGIGRRLQITGDGLHDPRANRSELSLCFRQRQNMLGRVDVTLMMLLLLLGFGLDRLGLGLIACLRFDHFIAP